MLFLPALGLALDWEYSVFLSHFLSVLFLPALNLGFASRSLPFNPPKNHDHRKLNSYSPASDEFPASDSGNNQLAQQRSSLRYYRDFLEGLVAVMRGGQADAVAQLVALIRSGASNDEIYHAIQRAQIEQAASS